MSSDYNYATARMDASAWSDWRSNLEREFRDLARRAAPSRERVIEIGMRCPMVSACLSAWRRGEMSWEEALSQAILLLSDSVERYRDLSVKRAMLDPHAIQPPTEPTLQPQGP